MKKKILGSIAAVSLAGLTAIPSLCIVSSADYTAVKQNHKYPSDVAYLGYDGYWYPNLEALVDGTGRTDYQLEQSTPQGGAYGYSSSNQYFNAFYGYYQSYTGSYTYSVAGYREDDTSVPYYIPAGYRYASDYSYLKKGVWYPNLEALKKATGSYSYEERIIPQQAYTPKFHYFDPVHGYYVSSKSNQYVIEVSAGNTTMYYSYYSTHTDRYYPTYEEALKVSGNDPSKVVYVGDYIDGYYYNGKYYDPYAYYLLMQQQKNKDDSSSSSSSSSSSVTINGKTGWTSVTNAIKSAANGKTLVVSMKNETTIPSSVTSALKGKNVNVQFKLGNGTVFTINGKDISSAKDINIKTTYNTNRVPSKLVKSAYKKKNAVSTAQLSIGSNTFGAEVDITVKFSTKRSGCTAYLYLYNSDKNTLSLVDTSSVKSSGQCTFDGVTKGGDFVVVLS
ncbi:MAG: hypothetical protein J1E40_05645 [Oscillospiraceae bacterium]|nr:hypothetical protein [Oscillospiraceae bacterium]